jgi:hypothetical protein
MSEGSAGADPSPAIAADATLPVGRDPGDEPQPVGTDRTDPSAGNDHLDGDAIPDRLPARLVGAVVGATLLTRLPGLIAERAFNSDEATLAVGGRVLRGGGSLYVDLIDRKPPLPFAAYSLVARLTGTDDLRPVRALVMVLIAVTALVLADEGRRRWGLRAAWTAGLACVLAASALSPRDAQAANFELFALLPIAVAFVAAARGRSIVAGAALAIAVLCKQPAAVTAVPVVWSLWRHGRWRSLAVGAAAGGGTGLLLAAPFGVSRVIHWALLGTGGYLSLAPADLGVAAVRLLEMLGLAILFWGGALLLGVASRPAAGRSGVDPPDRHVDLDLWLLLGASVLGVVAGFRFFPHYLLQLVPAVALLAGRGAARRPSWIRPALAWGVAALVLAGGMAWFDAVTPAPKLERRLARYVDRQTRPGDEIFVWGNSPEVYWRSRRNPAGGFTHTEFVTGYSGGRRKEKASEAKVPDEALYRTFVRRLRTDRPVLVLDTAAADERGGHWFPVSRFPKVEQILRERYDEVTTLDGVRVYRLRNRA